MKCGKFSKETSYDEWGRVYQSDEYGIDQTNGAQGAAQTTLYWYGPNGNLIKQQHPNGAFTKSTYDALGRKTHNYLCYHVGESGYSAAGNTSGDTIVEQTESKYDSSGQTILTVRTEESLDIGFSDQKAIVWNWYDILGRVTKTADFGNTGSTTQRPETMTGARVTEYAYCETVESGENRWSYITGPDGVKYGNEINALGETVLQWTKASNSSDCKVTTTTYNAMGNRTLVTEYQEYLTASQLPPVWSAQTLENATPCTTEYAYGVAKNLNADRSWKRNCITSMSLLREIHPPDPETGDPVGTDRWRNKFAYNALGEIIGIGTCRKSYEDQSEEWISERIGREIMYDTLGRKISDEAVEGEIDGDLVPVEDVIGEVDDARSLSWEYDCLGRKVAAETYDDVEGSGDLLNSVAYAYDDYGAVLSVTEDPDGDESGQPVTTSYSYENKQMGAGAVFHRLTSYTVSGKTIGVSYGASASASDILGRIEKYTWERYTGKEYYCAEEFIGASRWMKSEFHRYYDNAQPNMQHSLTQQVASVNNFGAPEEFQCVQEYDPRDNEPEPLTISREYSYSTASSGAKLQRLTGIDDDITEEQYGTGIEKKFYRSLGYDGFGQVNQATLDENNDQVYENNRGWTYDAAGNWLNYSYLLNGQTTEEERGYNRRNEIDTIEEEGDHVVYDDTGSIVEHDYANHGVEDKSFAYDAWGRMCGYGTTGQSLTVHYGRDAMGRVISRNLTTYHYGNERGPLLRGGSIPQIYVRSRESNRLVALWEIEAAGGQYIFWYIVDAAGGEIAGICSFEESGSDSAYTLYYYSPTGELDDTEADDTSSHNGNNDLFGGVLYGGEALWEEETKTSVDVNDGEVAHHKIDEESEESEESGPNQPASKLPVCCRCIRLQLRANTYNPSIMPSGEVLLDEYNVINSTRPFLIDPPNKTKNIKVPWNWLDLHVLYQKDPNCKPFHIWVTYHIKTRYIGGKFPFLKYISQTKKDADVDINNARFRPNMTRGNVGRMAVLATSSTGAYFGKNAEIRNGSFVTISVLDQKRNTKQNCITWNFKYSKESTRKNEQNNTLFTGWRKKLEKKGWDILNGPI